jgi:hypothetical protein
MTPAEKPRLVDKNFVLVVFDKKAITLPIPVERPAIKVNKKATTTLFKISLQSNNIIKP